MYKVTATEKNNKAATEYETKALLYLMNFRSDSDEIFYFVIDFFNDVTGIDSMGNKAWDVQSKASSNLSGKSIGRDLVTLFKNYLSELNFCFHILIVGGVSTSALKDSSLAMFNIGNFTTRAYNSIFKGLKQEAAEKEYIEEKSLITDSNIIDFLSKVTFIIGNKEKYEYINEIIKLSPSIIPDNNYLNKIFNQIRDQQSAKKNIHTEGVLVSDLRGFEIYKKHFTSNEIKLLVLSRLLHKNNIGEGCPVSFSIVLDGRDDEDRKELVENCKNDIYRMLFDKNNAIAYWVAFEEVYKTILHNPRNNVNDLFDLINKDKLNSKFLNFNSAKYFIALIKEGIEE